MARTGERYTTARSRLLTRPWLAVVEVETLDPGAGDEAAFWTTLRVALVERRGGGVVGRSTKRYVLAPHHVSRMNRLVGLRVGGRCRVVFDHAGQIAEIEATLLDVGPYDGWRPTDLVSGEGREATRGDQVEVRVTFEGAEPEVWRFRLGDREVFHTVEMLLYGMRPGGVREHGGIRVELVGVR